MPIDLKQYANKANLPSLPTIPMKTATVYLPPKASYVPTYKYNSSLTAPSRMFSTNIVQRTEDFAKTPQGTFALSAADAMLMGIPSALDKKAGITKNIDAMAEHPFAQFTGTLAGSLLPFGAADKALKGIKILKGMDKATRIARSSASGGAVMGLQGVIQGETPEQIGLDVLGGTIFGIAADLGLSAIGKYAGLAIRNLAKKMNVAPEEIGSKIASGDETILKNVKDEHNKLNITRTKPVASNKQHNVNAEGVKYYNNLIDEMNNINKELESNIGTLNNKKYKELQDKFDELVKTKENFETFFREKPRDMVNPRYLVSATKPLGQPLQKASELATEPPVIQGDTIPSNENIIHQNVTPVTQGITTIAPEVVPIFAKEGTVGAAQKATPSEVYISKAYTNTMKHLNLGDDIPDISSTIDDVNQGGVLFDKIPEIESVQRANQRLQTDFNGEVADLSTKESFSGEDVDTAFGILKEAAIRGDAKAIKKWALKIVEKAHDIGQGLQSFVKYSRTPAGQVIHAEKVVSEVEKDMIKHNPQLGKDIVKTNKEIKDIIEKVDTSATDDLVSEISSGKVTLGKAKETVSGIPKKETGKVKEEVSPEQLLAKRITSAIKPQNKQEENLINDMINELFGVAKESPIGSIPKAKASIFETISKAYSQRELYVQTWNKAKLILKEQFKDDANTLNILDNYFDKGIRPPVKLQTINKSINDSMKELGLNIKNIVDDFKNRTDKRQSIVDYIVARSGLIGDDAQSLSNTLNSRLKDLKKQYSDTLLEGKFREVTPQAKVETQSKLQSLVNAGVLQNKKYADKVMSKLSPMIAKMIKEKGIDITSLVKSGRGKTSQAKDKFLQELSDTLNVSKDDLDKILKIADDEFSKLTDAKRLQILKSHIKKPLGRTTPKTPLDKIKELIELGVYDNADLQDITRQIHGIPTLSPETAKSIYDNIRRATKIKDPYQKRRFLSLAQQEIDSLRPVKFRTKFRALQRIGMVLHPKTIMSRNILSNIDLLGLESAKDIPATMADIITSWARQSQRTTTFIPIKGSAAYAKGFYQGVKNTIKDAYYGVDTSISRTALELPDVHTFRQKYNDAKGAIQNLSNSTNVMLDFADEITRIGLKFGDTPFYEGARASRLAELKALGRDMADPNTELEAKLYALERVFQNNSKIMEMMSMIRQKMGLAGDLIMPFTQTPSNIFDKLLDYTPAGLAKAVYHLGASSAKGIEGGFNQKYFVDKIGRTFTGTGIAMLGYAMAKNGLITGSAPSSKEERENLIANKGWQPYSIKLGDRYYSYDWYGVNGLILSAAADAFNADVTDKEWLEALAIKATAFSDTIIKKSVLENLLSTFNSMTPTSTAMGGLMGASTQLAPSGLAGLVPLADKYQRETSDPNEIKASLNRVLNRIPIASQLLPMKYDVNGKPVLRSQGRGGIARFFEGVLLPYKVSEIKSDPVTDEIFRLKKAVPSADVYMNVMEKSFQAGGKPFELTTEEWQDMQKTMGINSTQYLTELFNSPEYKATTDDALKAKIVARMIAQARKDAKIKYLTDKGYNFSIVQKWIPIESWTVE